MSSPGQPDSRQQRLAGHLKALRQATGESAETFGKRFGWSQSKVSKIENASTRPSVEDVQTWLRHTAPTDDLSGELIALVRELHTQATAWRDANQDGFGTAQSTRRRRDRTATAFAFYQSEVVPGFLQTPDYARRLLEVHSHVPPEGIGAAVRARLDRQAVLFDPSVRFDFVITETALRWRPAPDSIAVTLGQLDRIGQLEPLPNINIGVVTREAQEVAKPLHSFVLVRYTDGPEVQVETLTAEVVATAPKDVADYERFFTEQLDHAVSGSALQELLRAIADDLRGRHSG